MAARYWRGTGDGNWGSTGNWSDTSGGATGFSVPTSSDDVTFDANGNNNCTINASTRSCLTLVITSGYTATITHSQILNIHGATWTLGANYTIAGSSHIILLGGTTITSNGKTWPNNLTLQGNVTRTLVGDFVVGGTTTTSGTLVLNRTTNETYSTNGITFGGGVSGTAKIIITGGVWSTGGATTQFPSQDVDLQGNITLFNGNIYYSGTNTLRYVSGIITIGGINSTLNIGGGCTLDTGGMNWQNVNISTASTFTLTTTLNVTNALVTPSTVGFTGSAGFNVNIFICSATTAVAITLKDGNTYTITGSLQCFSSRLGSIVLFTSSHASNKAILTLQNGATCQCLADFTRIDASGGRPIRTFNGTVTDCNNVVSFYDLKTVGSAL